MKKIDIDFEGDSGPVLDRVIDAYGFTAKIMLADHLGVAASTLSGRYRRGGFPSDIVVRCMAETGVSLEWLATGRGNRYENQSMDVLEIQNLKLLGGELFQSGHIKLDLVVFGAGRPTPSHPVSILDGNNYYIIEKQISDIHDGKWLIEIDNQFSIRDLTRMPMKKVRVSGVGMAFDCDIQELKAIGRVIKIIEDL
ncbi:MULTISPECIES: phage repressor protein CI [Serratia]|uniref:phage repressor protein CI n=1 Tax=Serratia TaxID=613 RepID=UPI00370F8AC8